MPGNLNRAKQFLPFAALKGFEEALRKKEEELEYESMRVLSSDQEEDIFYQFHSISVGTFVLVQYYNQNHYVTIEGYVRKIDFFHKYLILDETLIWCKDIIKIEC